MTGCHYNPLFANEEFVVCNEIGVFDIWNVTKLEDGSEEANKVHHLKLPPGTSNCVYSPDGQFVALTSGKESKTYIISSSSGNVMFTLVYPVPENPDQNRETYFSASSLFFENSCQVATIHDDKAICLWQLPAVYSLKTLCLLFLRARVLNITTSSSYVCLPGLKSVSVICMCNICNGIVFPCYIGPINE